MSIFSPEFVPLSSVRLSEYEECPQVCTWNLPTICLSDEHDFITSFETFNNVVEQDSESEEDSSELDVDVSMELRRQF